MRAFNNRNNDNGHPARRSLLQRASSALLFSRRRSTFGNVDGLDEEESHVARGPPRRDPPPIPARGASATPQPSLAPNRDIGLMVDAAPLAGHSRKNTTSNTWTTSSTELSEDTSLTKRTYFIQKYNDLAERNGLPSIVPPDFEERKQDKITVILDHGPNDNNIWKLLSRRTMSNIQPKDKTSKRVKQKRSMSEISRRVPIKSDCLKGENIDRLIVLCGKTRLSLPNGYSIGELVLPACLGATGYFLMQNGQGVNNIFRENGPKTEIMALYNHYALQEEDPDAVNHTVQSLKLPERLAGNIYVVADSFKKFLAGLPQGILGGIWLFEALVQVHHHLGTIEATRTRQTKIQARLIALAISCHSSKHQRDLMYAVFGLLSLIGRAGETAPHENTRGQPVPTEGNMGYEAIGRVFGPLLIGDSIYDTSSKSADVGSNETGQHSLGRSFKHRHKKAKSQAEAHDVLIDAKLKVLTACRVVEMVITHWRDVVRQSRKIYELPQPPVLDPASEEHYRGNADRSPTPSSSGRFVARPMTGPPRLGQDYHILPVPKHRSGPDGSSDIHLEAPFMTAEASSLGARSNIEASRHGTPRAEEHTLPSLFPVERTPQSLNLSIARSSFSVPSEGTPHSNNSRTRLLGSVSQAKPEEDEQPLHRFKSPRDASPTEVTHVDERVEIRSEQPPRGIVSRRIEKIEPKSAGVIARAFRAIRRSGATHHDDSRDDTEAFIAGPEYSSNGNTGVTIAGPEYTDLPRGGSRNQLVRTDRDEEVESLISLRTAVRTDPDQFRSTHGSRQHLPQPATPSRVGQSQVQAADTGNRVRALTAQYDRVPQNTATQSPVNRAAQRRGADADSSAQTQIVSPYRANPPPRFRSNDTLLSHRLSIHSLRTDISEQQQVDTPTRQRISHASHHSRSGAEELRQAAASEDLLQQSANLPQTGDGTESVIIGSPMISEDLPQQSSDLSQTSDGTESVITGSPAVSDRDARPGYLEMEARLAYAERSHGELRNLLMQREGELRTMSDSLRGSIESRNYYEQLYRLESRNNEYLIREHAALGRRFEEIEKKNAEYEEQIANLLKRNEQQAEQNTLNQVHVRPEVSGSSSDENGRLTREITGFFTGHDGTLGRNQSQISVSDSTRDRPATTATVDTIGESVGGRITEDNVRLSQENLEMSPGFNLPVGRHPQQQVASPDSSNDRSTITLTRGTPVQARRAIPAEAEEMGVTANNNTTRLSDEQSSVYDEDEDEEEATERPRHTAMAYEAI